MLFRLPALKMISFVKVRGTKKNLTRREQSVSTGSAYGTLKRCFAGTACPLTGFDSWKKVRSVGHCLITSFRVHNDGRGGINRTN